MNGSLDDELSYEDEPLDPFRLHMWWEGVLAGVAGTRDKTTSFPQCAIPLTRRWIVPAI
jgi:hypothetical protein